MSFPIFCAKIAEFCLKIENAAWKLRILHGSWEFCKFQEKALFCKKKFCVVAKENSPGSAKVLQLLILSPENELSQNHSGDVKPLWGNYLLGLWPKTAVVAKTFFFGVAFVELAHFQRFWGAVDWHFYRLQ